MFPHNFVVKEIEFWSGYNWGTIKLETSQARNVLLEHAKYHPFKPFTDGKSNPTNFVFDYNSAITSCHFYILNTTQYCVNKVNMLFMHTITTLDS